MEKALKCTIPLNNLQVATPFSYFFFSVALLPRKRKAFLRSHCEPRHMSSLDLGEMTAGRTAAAPLKLAKRPREAPLGEVSPLCWRTGSLNRRCALSTQGMSVNPWETVPARLGGASPISLTCSKEIGSGSGAKRP